MSLDKFVIKYLTLKRLIFLIVIAIYTCNYERTSKPALFFKKDIDYGGDNLAIDPSMIVANGDCVYLASTDLKSFKTTVKYIESFFRTMFPKIERRIQLWEPCATLRRSA